MDVVFNSNKKPTVGKPSVYTPTSMSHMKLPCERKSYYTKALVRIKADKRANQEWRKENARL